MIILYSGSTYSSKLTTEAKAHFFADKVQVAVDRDTILTFSFVSAQMLPALYSIFQWLPPHTVHVTHNETTLDSGYIPNSRFHVSCKYKLFTLQIQFFSPFIPWLRPHWKCLNMMSPTHKNYCDSLPWSIGWFPSYSIFSDLGLTQVSTWSYVSWRLFLTFLYLHNCYLVSCDTSYAQNVSQSV